MLVSIFFRWDWESINTIITEKIFREINSLVTHSCIEMVEMLLSRNFCQKGVRSKFRNLNDFDESNKFIVTWSLLHLIHLFNAILWCTRICIGSRFPNDSIQTAEYWQGNISSVSYNIYDFVRNSISRSKCYILYIDAKESLISTYFPG